MKLFMFFLFIYIHLKSCKRWVVCVCVVAISCLLPCHNGIELCLLLLIASEQSKLMHQKWLQTFSLFIFINCILPFKNSFDYSGIEHDKVPLVSVEEIPQSQELQSLSSITDDFTSEWAFLSVRTSIMKFFNNGMFSLYYV